MVLSRILDLDFSEFPEGERTPENSVKAKFTEIAHLPIAPPTSPRRNAALGRSFSDHSPTANIYSRWQHPPLRISIHRCYKL